MLRKKLFTPSAPTYFQWQRTKYQKAIGATLICHEPECGKVYRASQGTCSCVYTRSRSEFEANRRLLPVTLKAQAD